MKKGEEKQEGNKQQTTSTGTTTATTGATSARAIGTTSDRARPTQDIPLDKPITPSRIVRKNYGDFQEGQNEEQGESSHSYKTPATVIGRSSQEDNKFDISSNEKQHAKNIPQLYEVATNEAENDIIIPERNSNDNQTDHNFQQSMIPGAQRIRGIDYTPTNDDDEGNTPNFTENTGTNNTNFSIENDIDAPSTNDHNRQDDVVLDLLGTNMGHDDLITAELVVLEEAPPAELISASILDEHHQDSGLFNRKCLGISIIVLALGFVGLVLGFVLNTNNDSTTSNNVDRQKIGETSVQPSSKLPSFSPSLRPTSNYPTSSPSGYSTQSSHPSMAPTTYERWIQLGQVLQGPDRVYGFGFRVSLNDNGTRLAIYAVNSASSEVNAGVVYVYESNNNEDWQQLGQELQGNSLNDYFGLSLVLSGNGNRLAVAAWGADSDSTGNLEVGEVKVFEFLNNFDSQEWMQVGQTLQGESSDDHFGESLSLSRDGTLLAASTGGKDLRFETNVGEVKVFELTKNDTEWKQFGQSLQGESEYDVFGLPLSLSSDGMVLAAGAQGNNNGGTNAGQVQVFEFIETNNGTEWRQLGQALQGEVPYGQFGYSVSLSGDGTRLAASGANINDGFPFGEVKVFELINNRTEWKQLGQPVQGPVQDGDTYAIVASLSSDGTRLAINIWETDTNGSDTARVMVFELRDNNTEWIQLGQILKAESINSFGTSASISGDGARLAASDPGIDGGGLNSGQVQVFYLDDSD